MDKDAKAGRQRDLLSGFSVLEHGNVFSASVDEKVGKELNTTPDINERCSSQNHLQDDGAVYALRTSLALGTA